MAAIDRQEIMQDIRLFTSAPKAKFYSERFLHLDTGAVEATFCATGCPGYPKYEFFWDHCCQPKG